MATLLEIISGSVTKFQNISKEEWLSKPNPMKWSKKEILGHLIDSASNNLRRLIVTQYQPNDKIFYHQDEWVKIQNYQYAELSEMIHLWELLNKQLARVVENMPKENIDLTCDVGKQGPQLYSLQYLYDDYIRHLNHHLAQILN